MYTNLDLESWPRREHFEFFRKFEEPFFGLVADVDVTRAYASAKQKETSLYLYYLHAVLAAVNGVEALRYRISGDAVRVYERVDVSATVMRGDKTFGFSFMEYHSDFKTFAAGAQTEIARVQNTPGLITRTFDMENIIHFSAVPWVRFTSLSHARSFTFQDSCPKVSVGKITEENGRKVMPVSIHVHHALADGYHTGLFFEKLQQELDRV